MHESEVKGKSLSRVRLLATPWTAAYQAPPSMGFSRKEYWSGVPLSSPFEGLLEPKFVHMDFLCFSEVGLIFQGKSDRERSVNRVLGNVKYNNFLKYF